MEIITPNIGLIFWTTLFFLIVLLVLGTKVFPQISKALRTREEGIDAALRSAEDARKAVSALEQQVEEMKKQARAEREQMMKEAELNANRVMADAQEQAKKEADRIMKDAQVAIDSERRRMFDEVKQEVGSIALEIAEKVVRKQLSQEAEQQRLVEQLLQEAK